MPLTRFLILSDTHGTWTYLPSNPAPSVDVLLHCGDLTQVGGLPSFRRAIADIASVDAPLKLIIAGNHDLELDEKWMRENVETDAELEDHGDCVQFMRSQKDLGISFLEEGVHEFALQNGKILRIYASPYTPEFNGYAFAFAKEEDRFNKGSNSIPDEVDIVMMHGPPMFRDLDDFSLDKNQDGEHCGCEMLGTALRRARPVLHCFGHIHEGRGTMSMDWSSNEVSEMKNLMGVANSTGNHEERIGKGNSFCKR